MEVDVAGKDRQKQQLDCRIKMIKKENKVESDRIERLAKFHGERERSDVAWDLQR